MSYIDGFVAAVPNARKDEYLEQTAKSWEKFFKKNGALSHQECWGDDVPEGKLTSFSMAVKREPDETVVFAWIVWPDKETRDKAYATAGSTDMGEMPFDGKRMIYGGFTELFSARA